MTNFKDELRTYPWPLSSAIKAHGRRWLKDDRSDAVWQKISQAAGELNAHDFIRFVVTARARAAGLAPTLDFHSESERRLLASHMAHIKTVLKSKRSLSEIAEVLEKIASNFRVHDEMIQTRLQGLPATTISRKNVDGSQARRAFCLILFKFFKERCGKWMDSEVAVLLDVALPQKKKKDVSIDEVSEFRKKRTSKGRRKGR